MICEHCQKDTAEVTCQACNTSYCKRRCWDDHWCGVLTDREGRVVKIGDVLNYPTYDRSYKITEMPPSFVRGGVCYGDRVGKRWFDQKHIVIRPRLMRIQE